jgi:hypothetical protein
MGAIMSRQPVTRFSGRPVRWPVLAALCASLVAVPEAAAQLAGPSAGLALTLPSATRLAIGEMEKNLGPGVSWDLVRRNGLVLAVQGSGELRVAVFALAVEDGKIVKVWRSPSQVTVTAGSTSLSGRYLPDGMFGVPQPFGVVAEQAGTTVTAEEAMRAIDVRKASAFLDSRTAAGATGILLVAIPALSGSSKDAGSTTTSPRFVRPKVFD